MEDEIQFFDGDDDNPARVVGVPCFRSGKYPQGNFTDENVREICATYDRKFLEAPLTPDHKQEGEAWGWFTNFYTKEAEDGSGLEVLGDCDLLFIGEWMWKSGMFKRRSIEFWSDALLPNGKKGFYIKAVSLLGAMTPAVKGLRDMFNQLPSDATANGKPVFVNFSSQPEANVFSVDDPKTLELPNMFGGMATGNGLWLPQPVIAFTPEQVGLGKKFARKEIEDMTVKANEKKEGQEDKDKPTTASDQPTDNQETRFTDLEKRVEASEERARLAEAREAEANARVFKAEQEERFNDILEKNRDRVTPATEKILRTLFHAQPADSDTSRAAVKFTDGEGKEREDTLRGLVLSLMSQGAKVIDLDKQPKSDNENPATKKTAAFAEGDVAEPNTQAWFDQRHDRALALMKSEPERFSQYADAATEAEREMLSANPRKRA